MSLDIRVDNKDTRGDAIKMCPLISKHINARTVRRIGIGALALVPRLPVELRMLIYDRVPITLSLRLQGDAVLTLSLKN